MAGTFYQKSMHSLSILSSANSTSTRQPNNNSTTAVSSVSNSTLNKSILAPSSSLLETSAQSNSDQSFSKVRDENPFLELPARKLHKQYHHENNNTNNKSSSGPSSSFPAFAASSTSTSKKPLIPYKYSTTTTPAVAAVTGIQAPSGKPQRLILTRVLASNSVARLTSTSSDLLGILASPSLPLSTSSTPTLISRSAKAGVNLFTNTESKTSTTPSQSINSENMVDEDNREFSYSESNQHPSTTPKAPPSREYYDFIRNGMSTSMRFDQRLQEADQDMEVQEQNQDSEHNALQQQQQQQQQQENHETESGTEGSIPVNSTIMAFARKSIMQHASSSPHSIFRKLSNNRKAASAINSINIPTPKEKNSVDESQRDTAVKVSKLNSTTLPSTTFTFESKPKPLGPINSEKALTPTALLSTVTDTSTSASTGTRSADASVVVSSSLPTGSTATNSIINLPSSIFNRGVLDLSQQTEPPFSRKHVMSNITTQATIPIPRDTIAKPQQNAPMETLSPRPSTPPARSNLHASLPAPDSGMSMDFVGETDSSNTREPVQFDLRSALRMDSARIQYKLPSLIASLSPPTSPKRRPSPYTVLSPNERDILRSRRMPRFKARPLNPKVFTSAGDLGVPRIQKQPLTVPKSPVFSKPRVRNTIAESGIKKESVVNSATALRLKNMIKSEPPKRQTAVSAGNLRDRTNNQTTNSHGQVTGLARSSSSPALSGAWSTPLSVPAVDQTRANINLGSIKGPPLRQETPSSASVSRATTASIAGVTARADTRGQQRQLSKLRRPVTRPAPFSFATTELQRKRMMFEPTPNNATVTTNSFKSKSNSRLLVSSSNSTLRLEDL
ncbi:hypothetical protein BGZ46_010490 [Entomortierella lignicola]|nr:hypothetical protein BGZ46_010490 [Entomortierella lignicola]